MGTLGKVGEKQSNRKEREERKGIQGMMQLTASARRMRQADAANSCFLASFAPLRFTLPDFKLSDERGEDLTATPGRC